MDATVVLALSLNETSGEKPPLRDYCLTGLDDLEGTGQKGFLCGSGAMLLTLFVGNAMHVMKVHWLPESLVAVTFGALLGFGLWASPQFGRAHHLDFEAEFLWFALYLKLFALPLIISEAGWSLKLRDFFSQLTYILIFAILGTVISIAVVSSLMVATADFHGISDQKTAWAYASLISSVDPVATLATFGQLNVDRLLFILVFGESQINDAVAITMFDAFNSPKGKHSAVNLVLMTLWYLFGSIALGLALATAYILLFRCGRMKHSYHQQILFLTISTTFTYQLAEVAEMSGIITVLFCAIMLSAYTPPHLSPDGIRYFSFLLKQLASLCDMLIFVFVGVSAVRVTSKDLLLSAWLMFYVLVSRAAAIFPLGLLCNAIKACVGRKLPAEKRIWISWKHMVMMWHGGVCRGGVSLWMGTELGNWVDESNGTGTRQRLISATFVLICVFLLIFGGTTSLCMRGLGLPMGAEVSTGKTLYGEGDKSGKAWRLARWLSAHIVRPVLVGEKNMRQHQDMTRRSSINSILQDNPRLRSASQAAAVLDLFGSDDPDHLEQIEDVTQDSDSSEGDSPAASLGGSSDHDGSGSSSSEAML